MIYEVRSMYIDMCRFELSSDLFVQVLALIHHALGTHFPTDRYLFVTAVSFVLF